MSQLEGIEMVPCHWCGQPTPSVGSEECDNCHEVWGRILTMSDRVLKKMMEARKEFQNG